MPAKRIYQVKLLTKAGGRRGYVSVYGVSARGYLFIFSLKFQKQGIPSEAATAPGVPSQSPACFRPCLPFPPLSPCPSLELGVAGGAPENASTQLQPFSRD